MHNCEQNLTDLFWFNSIKFNSENQTSGKMANKEVQWWITVNKHAQQLTKFDWLILIQFNSIQFRKSDLRRNGEQGCTVVNNS